MLELHYKDRNRIMDLLLDNPFFLKSDNLQLLMSRAGLDDLNPFVNWNGIPAAVLNNLITELCGREMITVTDYALGRFLNASMDNLGLGDKREIQQIIIKYKLMVPSSVSPNVPKELKPVKEEFQLLSEAVIGENTLRHISYLIQALDISRCVCLIKVLIDSYYESGSGFLVSPNLVVTNNHVISNRNLLRDCVFRFNFQNNIRGMLEEYMDYKFEGGGIFYTNEVLDYSIIQLTDFPGRKWGYAKYTLSPPEVKKRVNIIQHPGGLPKKISLQNNFVEVVDDQRVQYLTATEPGSSGSPVFDDNWKLVAVHRGTREIRISDVGQTHYRNEGVRVTKILEDVPSNIRELMNEARGTDDRE